MDTDLAQRMGRKEFTDGARRDVGSATSSSVRRYASAYESGRRLSDVARELEVRPDLIRRWRRKFSGGEPGRASDDRGAGDSAATASAVSGARGARHPKKSLGDLLGSAAVRLDLVERLRGQSSGAADSAEVLEVSRSGHYARRRCAQSRPGYGKIADSSKRSWRHTPQREAGMGRRESSTTYAGRGVKTSRKARGATASASWASGPRVDAGFASPPSRSTRTRWPTTACSAGSTPAGPTRFGWETSPTWRRAAGGSTWLS